MKVATGAAGVSSAKSTRQLATVLKNLTGAAGVSSAKSTRQLATVLKNLVLRKQFSNVKTFFMLKILLVLGCSNND